MKKVSVILPVYNSSKTIRKAVDSIINQTYNNLELIIINDGSIDDTNKIIRSYHDKRIQIIEERNHGTGYARNNGLINSNGEYIVFIDADDYYDTKFLEDNMKLVDKYNLDILTTPKRNNLKINSNPISKNVAFKYLISLPEILSMSLMGNIYKKEVIKNLCFDETNHFEDIEFNVRAFLNSKRYYFNNHQYYFINNNTNSRSNYYGELDRLISCQKCFDDVSKLLPNMLDEFKVYSIFNAIAITNMMIVNNSFNNEKINIINKFVKENIKYLKNSHYDFSKKLQVYIYNYCFGLYKLLYKLIKR